MSSWAARSFTYRVINAYYFTPLRFGVYAGDGDFLPFRHIFCEQQIFLADIWTRIISLHVGIGVRGHPDKIADQISDADTTSFAQDPESKVACETSCHHRSGSYRREVNSEAYIDLQAVARKVIYRHKAMTAATSA